MYWDEFSKDPGRWVMRHLDRAKCSYPVRQVTEEEIFWEGIGNYLFLIDAAKVKHLYNSFNN